MGNLDNFRDKKHLLTSYLKWSMFFPTSQIFIKVSQLKTSTPASVRLFARKSILSFGKEHLVSTMWNISFIMDFPDHRKKWRYFPSSPKRTLVIVQQEMAGAASIAGMKNISHFRRIRNRMNEWICKTLLIVLSFLSFVAGKFMVFHLVIVRFTCKGKGPGKVYPCSILPCYCSKLMFKK